MDVTQTKLLYLEGRDLTLTKVKQLGQLISTSTKNCFIKAKFGPTVMSLWTKQHESYGSLRVVQL